MPPFTIEIKDFDGDTLVEYEKPADLSYSFQSGSSGPGKCQWSLAEADDVLTPDAFAPKSKDWLLLDNGFPVQGGPIMSVNMPLGRDVISVVGHDWLEWLNQPWRNYYDTDAMSYSDDIATIISIADLNEFHRLFPAGSVLQEWIEAVFASLCEDATEQIILTPLFDGTAFDEELVGQISRSSGLTGLAILQRLAQMGTPYGFDFWANWNKEITFTGPRKTDPLSVFPIAGFFEDSGHWFGEPYEGSAVVDGDWTNNGPLGTDILFTDGIGNASRYYRKQHQDSVDQFRRWGYDIVIGQSDPLTVGTLDQGDFKAAAAQYRALFPQKELALTVKPELFTFDKVLYDPVDVDYQKHPGSFHRIDAYFWITSQTYREAVSGSGDWLCDLTLDQIYIPIS